MAPRFVFLEGAACTAKSSICNVLASRGHRVHFESFIELCDLHPQYRPGQLIMSFKWGNDIISRMEEFSRTSHELVFFDRSLLTPYVFARSTPREKLALYVDLMEELKSSYSCSVVLLHADRTVVRNRLLDRYNRSTEAEKVIRQSLNELSEEFVDEINSRYSDLEKSGAFDLKFDTSLGTLEEVTDGLMKTLQLEEGTNIRKD